MKKKKIIAQIIGAVLILSCIFVCKNVKIPELNSAYNYVYSLIGDKITMKEITVFKSKAIEKIKGTPSQVVSAVVKANEGSKYAQPIDEKSTDNKKQVHSVAGGMVQQIGNNKQNGLFIVIKHENAKSVYGHLNDISVAPKERVQRGEIIGNYNSDCGEEFYYHLEENL